jgi:amino acid adenylation domain-containing protein
MNDAARGSGVITTRDRLVALSPERRALAERLLAARSERAAVVPESDLGPRDRGERVPASFVQERLTILSELEPGSPFYNTPLGVRLRGPLDTRALRRSLDQLIERHEALRATLHVDGDAVTQRFVAPYSLELPMTDLSGLSREAARATALQQATQLAREPFALATAPLARASLWRIREEEHLLLLVFHHAVVDGWSAGILLREAAGVYRDLRAGRDPVLPALPLSYADYAIWQRERLRDGVFEPQLRYWLDALAGAPPLLDLPLDRPRPTRSARQGDRVGLRLEPALHRTLVRLGRAQGATPFMTLLAAWATLLSRVSGQDDLVIGTPVAGRLRATLEDLVGCFVNTLPIRLRLDGDPTFRDLLERVRATTLSAFEYQELPFERLVEALGPRRDQSTSPLFQAFFVLQNAPLPPLELPDLILEPVRVPTATSKFDLSLEATEERGLGLGLEVDTEILERATGQRHLRHLRTLLEGIANRPDRRLSQLPLLEAGETRRILVAWNDTARDYEERRRIDQLVDEQALRDPEAPALRFEAETMTYGELRERANRLAHRLQREGVGPDDRVGVAMERSFELVVALLAVLKSGAAYVPLDPDHPRDRLQTILTGAGIGVVVAQCDVASRLPTTDARILRFDREEDPSRGLPSTTPRPATGDDHLAYVIYTSGSTGEPKGAMNTHGAIRNRLLWMQEAYRLSSDDRVLQKTPVGFDVSVWEFFWPLAAGATLVIARPGGHQDPAYLARIIREEGVTTLHFVPSMLQHFLDEPTANECRSLRRVICSGEALPFELQRRFFRRLSCEVHNLYGPTEAAIDVTAWPCSPADQGPTVPIGRPIANTVMRVLDPWLEPVPVGVAGELFIGGEGLARGYLGRPDLTAERFVPDPFAEAPGARLYRTGDRARYRPDGALEFLGRLDFQVKVRGVRIELPEIEAHLLRHPDVAEAAAVVHPDRTGDLQIVAWVVSRGSDFDPDALRRHLESTLPAAMVPARFEAVEALPLSPNGKLDRRALAGRQLPTANRGALPSAPPATEAEGRVAEAFAAVLGVEVGRESDFFELGGDSFKAIRVVRRLENRIAVSDLFRHPRVRDLAPRLGVFPSAGRLRTVRAGTSGSDSTLIGVPYGGGSVIAYHRLAERLPDGWALEGVSLPGHEPGEPEPSEDAPCRVEELAELVAAEIDARGLGPLALYGHCVGAALAVEVGRLLERRGRRLDAVFVGASMPPLRRLARLEVPAILLRDRVRSDRRLVLGLRTLGGLNGSLPGEDLARIVREFRRDLREAISYFGRSYRRPRRPLRAPLVCIAADDDPLTARHRSRYRRWHWFADRVELVTLPAGGHYFLESRAEELASIVARAASGDLAGATSRPKGDPR